MTSNHRMPVAALLLAVPLAVLGGCEDVETTRISDDRGGMEAAAPAETTSVEPVGRYGSALSGAKRAAQNTVDDVEARQKQLEEQINKQLEGGG